MKVTTILKQSCYLLIAAMVLGACMRPLITYINFPAIVIPPSELYLLAVLGVILCVLWGVYRAMCEQYGQLERAPLYGLILLCVASALSNITSLYEIVHYGLFIWFNPAFLKCLFNNGNLLAYVCALHIYLGDVALQVIKWLITLHTLQALKKKVWDNGELK